MHGLEFDIKPGMTVRTVYGPDRFYHGFSANGDGDVVLYVAKALLPAFVDGRSFRVPENTYPDQ